MKKCSTCKTIKDYDLFVKNKSSKDGVTRECKDCTKKRLRLFYQKNKKRILEKNKDYMKAYLPDYYKANKDKLILNSKANYEKNKPEIMKKAKIYNRKRRASDLDYKMLCVLRSRVSNAVSRGYKNTKTKELLGCDIEYFKMYIEEQFTEGMSWDNYGRYGWHIDHIIPCSKFNLKDVEDQKQCFHYTNLQPMWAKDNHSKSDKILNPIQTKLLV